MDEKVEYQKRNPYGRVYRKSLLKCTCETCNLCRQRVNKRKLRRRKAGWPEEWMDYDPRK